MFGKQLREGCNSKVNPVVNASPNPSFKKQLVAWACVFACFILIAVLWKFGVFSAAGKAVVDHSSNTMQKEAERQNQPKIVVLKNGERIECKKVNDQGLYWGLSRADGKFSAVKKDDVSEVIDETPKP